MLTELDKGKFLKLFNRGGYVLNFSTNDFDVFTLESVGLALCSTYNLSKGKSLMTYVNSGSEKDILKLFRDLLDYYKENYEFEIENSSEYSKLYKQCESILDNILFNKTPHIKAANQLKENFTSEYLSKQIDLMLKMQSENPTEAIGKAKELVESCCKTVLENSGHTWEKEWKMPRLTSETLGLLNLMPNNIPEEKTAAKEIKAILGNLCAITSNLAALRNPYGAGHGKSSTYKGLDERHAKLAVGSSITLTSFIWDTYKERNL